MKSFEKFEEDYHNNEVQNEVLETIDLAKSLLDFDYLPKIRKYIYENDMYFEYLKYFSKYKSLNLFKLGWRFQYGTSKKWAGLCSAEETKIMASKKNRNLFVSIDFVKHDENWKQNAIDVIMHEIAHAIVFEIFYFNEYNDYSTLTTIDPQHISTDGHGATWSMLCSAIADGKVCEMYYKNAKLKDSFKLYKYECFNCGNIKYGNVINFATRCSNCYKPIIIEKNK